MPGPTGQSAPPAISARLLFTATVFAGSFLLFLIQPMIARVALPRLGGAPAVWNSAMVVYQLLLLGGYAYAHWLAQRSPKTQAVAHLLVMLAAVLFLPIGLSGATPPEGISAFVWVPWLFLSSIGPVFLVISANAPLLQRWFASTGSGDPYPLYAASNLGSFAGLIAYPLLLEPLLAVTEQRLLWSLGYCLLLALLAACAAIMARRGQREPAEARAEPIEPRKALNWVWLAFVPSALMLATTQFITTDIMPMPLLWVLPLGLYLLSFTIAFASRSRAAELLSTVAPYTLVPAAIAIFMSDRLLPVVIGVLLVALFSISTACHFRIYRSRPPAAQLTGFYLAVAAGGALGGLFCALVAPLIFDWTYEYPLLLIAAALTLLPSSESLVPSRWLEGRHSVKIAAALSVALVGAAMLAAIVWPENDDLFLYGSLAALAVGTFAVVSRLLMAAIMAAAMVLGGAWEKVELSFTPGRMIRTYFGVYSVVDSGQSRQLLHGTTLHGVQILTPGWERYPTTYFGAESGVGRALELVPRMFGPAAVISVVGLGTGTLSCFRKPQQRWTFFELDPAVVQIATESGHFSFIERCAPDAQVVVGDARLELAKAQPAAADVLVVDAFSSDAVPMHLLTKEAFDVYGRHLKPDGLLLIHVSNRHLDLEPVVAAVPGWKSQLGRFHPGWDFRHEVGSDWIALSRSPRTIDVLVALSEEAFWRRTTSDTHLWTDERASLLPVFR